MSGTDPLTGARYPTSGDAPQVYQDIKNAVNDLSDNTIPRFSSTATRDTAYAAWVAAGNAMSAGLVCSVSGAGLMEWDGVEWKGLRGPIAVSSASTVYSSGGANPAGTIDQRITGNITIATSQLLRSGRMYRVEFKGRAWAGVAGVQVSLRIRVGTQATLTTANTVVAAHQWVTDLVGSADATDAKFDGVFAVQSNGTYGAALFGKCASGTFSVASDDRGKYDMVLTDCGPFVTGLTVVS